MGLQTTQKSSPRSNDNSVKNGFQSLSPDYDKLGDKIAQKEYSEGLIQLKF